jgi:hypothetical protein
MKNISHGRAAFFALGFGYYHAVLGVLNFTAYQRPIPAAIAIVLYLVAIGWAVGHRPGLGLPDEAVIFALLTAAVVPVLGIYAIGDTVNFQDLIWFILGIGTLMAVLAVRERGKISWAGTLIMIVEMTIWGGIELLIDGQLFGVILLVLAAQGVFAALVSSRRASLEFLSRALVVDSDRVSQSAARAHTRLRMTAALDSALPLLKLIEQKNGNMTVSDTKELLLGEAGIRDQVRAPGFQDEKLVGAVLGARKKGLEVILMDDGGMDLLEAKERLQITDKLVETLDGLSAGRVVIRSVADETWTVSLLAVSPGAAAPEVFLRL